MRFDLTITGGQDAPGGYQVVAESPAFENEPGRRQAGRLRPPERGFDRLRTEAEAAVLESSLRRVPTEHEETIQRVGGRLFQALPEPVGTLLCDSVMRAEAARERLQVALRVDPPELARLPWELLHMDKLRHPFRRHHLVRQLPVGGTRLPAPAVQAPLRVLAVTGAVDQLDPDREHELLKTALQPLLQAGQIALTWLPGVTWQRLDQELQSREWHIFHFIGHGVYRAQQREGVIVLNDGRGGGEEIAAEQVAELFRTSRSSIRLVLLNACQTAMTDGADQLSSVAGALVDQGIPAVVAMQFPITDKAAIRFSRTYYGALAHPQPVEAAVTTARLGVWMGLERSLEWGTPVLYMSAPGEDVFTVWRPAEIATVEPGHSVTGAVFSPAGDVLVLTCRDVRRPLETKVGDWRVDLPAPTWREKLYRLMFNPDLTGAAVSPDGRWLATVGADRTVRVVDRTGAAPIRRPLLHPDEVPDAAFGPTEAGSADGPERASSQPLATACLDGEVRLWRVASDGRAEMLSTLTHESPVLAVAWRPSGDRLATACENGTARVWDTDTRQETFLAKHAGPVRQVAFSPDGCRLATACQDGSARIWRVGDSPPLWQLVHEAAVWSVAFHPDGQQLATGSEDGSVRIWDACTGQQTFLVEHDKPVWQVAFSPDGRWLAIAGEDGTCRVWQLTDVTVVEVSLDDRVPAGEDEALATELRQLSFLPVTVREPVQRSWDPTPWLALLTLPLERFLREVLSDTGKHAYRRVLDWIRRRREQRAADHREVPVLGVRDLLSRATFSWDPDLPDEAIRQLRELDLSGFEGRTFYWDPDKGRWLPRRPPR